MCCKTKKRLKVCDMHETREDAEMVLASVTVVDGRSETPAATGAQVSDKGTAEHVGAAPTGSPKNQADASGAGDTDADNTMTKQAGAAPAGSLDIPACGACTIPADAAAAGDKESDKVGATSVGNPGNTDSLTRTTERMVAGTAEKPPILVAEPAAGGGASDTEHNGAAHAERLEIDANKYTREVAQWLTSLTSKASERGVFLPVILTEMCPSPQKRARRSWNWYLGSKGVTPRCFDVR